MSSQSQRGSKAAAGLGQLRLLYGMAIGAIVLVLLVAGGLILSGLASGLLAALVGLAAVGAASYLGWAILPRAVDVPVEGVRLSAQLQPKLINMISEVATSMQAPIPDDVLLTSKMEATLHLRGGVFDAKPEVTLTIGVPLIQFLSPVQVRAAIARELALISPLTSPQGAKLYQTRDAVRRTLTGLVRHQGSAGGRAPFMVIGNQFLKASESAAREQELAADELAASLTTPEDVVDALLRMKAGASAWASYWHDTAEQVISVGLRPSLIIGFAHHIRIPEVQERMRTEIGALLAAESPVGVSSTPSLPERARALGLAPTALEDTVESAINILDDLAKVEEAILRAELSDQRYLSLKPANSENLVQRVHLPKWWALVDRYGRLLDGVNAENMHTITAKMSDIAAKLTKGDDANLNAEERNRLAFTLVGSAFTIALMRAGWSVHSFPGQEVTCRQGSKSVESFVTIERLASGELSPEDWADDCDELRIRGLSLVPIARTVPIGWTMPAAA